MTLDTSSPNGGTPRACSTVRGLPHTSREAGATPRCYGNPRQLAEEAGTRISVCKLLFAIAGYDLEKVVLIRSSTTEPDVIRLRRAVVWASKFHTNASFPEIGRALNCSAAAVIDGLEETKRLWLVDPTFRSLCETSPRPAK